MIISLIFLGLIVFLCYEIFRYFKLKANAFSKDEVRRAANEQALRMKYKDPVISCDYCGSKVDTTKHRVCPQCGAPFDNDEEWKSRHNSVDEKFIEKSTDNLISQREKKANSELVAVKKRIRLTLIALLAMFLIAIIVAIAASTGSSSRDVRKNENIETVDSYDYTKAEYEPLDGGIIYDDGEISIAVTGFYKQYENYYHDNDGPVQVEFHVINNMDKDIKINMSCNSVNGLANNSSYMFVYNTFKKHSDITFYEKFFHIQNQTISEIVIEKVEIRTTDYETQRTLADPVTVKTTSDAWYTDDFSGDLLIFSNDKVDVYATLLAADYYREGYKIYVQNKTDKGFYVSSDDLKLDNLLVDTAGIYKSYMPAKYIFASGSIYPYSEEYKELHDHKVSINISFSCPEDPSLDFSTGYQDISYPLFNE